MVSVIERPRLTTKLYRDFFARPALVVAYDVLGRTIVSQVPGRKEVIARIKEVAAWQGEEDSSARTIRYAPGLIGISKKYGQNLIDIGTGSPRSASCITLVALDSPDGIIQGPGRTSEYLGITDLFDSAPIDDPYFWIGGEAVSTDQILQRNKIVPANCKGYFYFK